MECEKGAESFMVKRREMIEKQQRSRREQIFNRTRKILAESDHLETQPQENPSEAPTGKIANHSICQQNKTPTNGHANQTRVSYHTPKKKWQYYKNFQYPEWMVQPPHNLAEYYFCTRPTGQRVFIHFKRQKIIIISLYGQALRTINLCKSSYNGTLLEGYYIKEQNVLVISDLLVWKENPMSSSEFQFRMAWLLNNFVVSAVQNSMTQQPVELKVITFYNVNKENLLTVYGSMAKGKLDHDGLLFFHKDSFYLHEVNPMVLLWKDLVTSPMLSSQFKNNSQLEHFQQIQNIQEQNECENQLKNLSLKQKNTHFYGYFSANEQTVYTFDRIGLVKLNIEENKRLSEFNNDCIVKFTFLSIREKHHGPIEEILSDRDYQIYKAQTIHTEEEEGRDEGEFPYVLEGFEILSVHEVNSRIPDPISKVFWKHNFANNIMINFNSLLSQIQYQLHQAITRISVEMDIE